MKDAFGGIMSLVFIAIFLVIIEGILGFIVSYSKAFRMKNAIISYVEQYEGAGCFSGSGGNGTCQKKILESAQRFGYSPPNLKCPRGDNWGMDSQKLFCYSKRDSDSGNNNVYSIVTQVDINIPIITNIMGISFFQVHGDTKPVKKNK